MVAIFVVLTVLLLILVDAWMEHRRSPAEKVAPVRVRPPVRTRNEAPALPKTAVGPGRFLHPAHLWAQIRALGTMRVGLDDLLADAVGPEAAFTPVEAGTTLSAGDPVATVEVEGRKMTIPSPFSGTVQAVNKPANARDWLCELWAPNLGTEIAPLMMGETAANWLRGEMDRFREWLVQRPMAVALPDGGDPVPGVLAHLDQASWTAFETDFICVDGSCNHSLFKGAGRSPEREA